MIAGIVIGLIVIILLIIFIVTYNGLVGLRNTVKNAWAQIDVQLKRRYDLIPNLVEVAKGYLAHERDTLEAIINARNNANNELRLAMAAPGNSREMTGLANAEGVLKNSLGRLQVTLEAYPDLKASVNMQQLSEEMSSTENKLAFARQVL